MHFSPHPQVWQNLGDCKAFGVQKYKNNKIFKSLTAGITANDVQIPLDMGGTQSRALKQKQDKHIHFHFDYFVVL